MLPIFDPIMDWYEMLYENPPSNRALRLFLWIIQVPFGFLIGGFVLIGSFVLFAVIFPIAVVCSVVENFKEFMGKDADNA